MRKGCTVIKLSDVTAIICGGEQTDHTCNEDAIVYTTKHNRFFFHDRKTASSWYSKHYKEVLSSSVACTICGRAAIDNAMWLDI